MVKRLFDLLASLFGIVLFSPLIVVVALLIKLGSKGPVFYQGLRIGRNEKPFRMLKFRSMIVDAQKSGVTSTSDDDDRITKTGKWIRKYKFDEIPQLFNVFVGNMSFVGPRPQVPWAVKTYTDEERKVLLSVRPGITDLASIKFHNEGEILKGSTDPDKDYMEKIHPEKVRLGMEYVKNISLLNDLKIVFKTFLRLLIKKA